MSLTSLSTRMVAHRFVAHGRRVTLDRLVRACGELLGLPKSGMRALQQHAGTQTQPEGKYEAAIVMAADTTEQVEAGEFISEPIMNPLQVRLLFPRQTRM